MKRSKKSSLVLAAALGLATTLGVSDASAVRMTMLQNLMKRMNGFVNAGNMKSTAMILNLVKNTGPEEYGQWTQIASKAQAAAAAGDVVALKSACKSCHDQYRESYKAKYGSGGSDKGPPVPVPVD
ncbi:MAG: hypothetical protein KIS78_07235 [Labilithrix sp.]|nr:hypothetical protein [Labilithrix sp.]MCW5832224.1 hypothetical protein [Labilithrix sp.]